jgi:hypothetical protein
MDLGVTAADLGMIRETMMNNKDKFRSLDDFKGFFGQALQMIAYGQPEMMDPKKAMMMGVMQHFAPLKEKLEKEFPTWDAATAPSIIAEFRRFIESEMKAPA